MNIAFLETFLAVVQAGNLNKAARHLNVTQSTVTTRLDTLEDMLGQKLLMRSRRGARLTKAGFAFQRHAELVVQSWQQARKVVGLPRGYSGLFSMACPHDLWDSTGAAWLERIRTAHPDLALEAWPGEPADIRNWLMSGLVDAALLTEPVAGTGLASRIAASERLVRVSTEPGGTANYVYVDLGPDFRRRHSLIDRGDETPRMTFGSSRWALDFILAHGGSAYLPWPLAEPLIAAGRLHVLAEAPAFARQVALVWREAGREAFPWIDDAAYWPA